MTTDAFTTAARKEAQLASLDRNGRIGGVGDLGVHMAVWARDHLANRIAAALDIHTEDDGHCTYCRHPDGTGEYTAPAWPCPTVAALTWETPCDCGGAPAEIGGAQHRDGCGEETP